MKNKSLLNKIVAGMVAGGVLLSTSGFVYATSISKSQSAATTHQQQNIDRSGKERKDPEAALKEQLDKLVAAETITQEQEDKLIALQKQKAEDRKAEMDKVKAMTDAERKAYFESKSQENHDPFADLVTAGILTQSQADAIKATFPQPQGLKDRRGDAPVDATTQNQ